MPVDPNALFEAVMSVLSRIPSGLLVALLLGGPTAIWLVLRLVRQREAPSRFASVASDLHWVCAECRSLNEARNDRCYRCQKARTDAVLPLLAGPSTADSPGVGLPVGPGIPAVPASANWLGLDAADDGSDAVDDAPDPIAEPVPALAGPPPDARPLLEPLILEPRPKVARRKSSRSARRN